MGKRAGVSPDGKRLTALQKLHLLGETLRQRCLTQIFFEALLSLLLKRADPFVLKRDYPTFVVDVPMETIFNKFIYFSYIRMAV